MVMRELNRMILVLGCALQEDPTEDGEPPFIAYSKSPLLPFLRYQQKVIPDQLVDLLVSDSAIPNGKKIFIEPFCANIVDV